MPCSTCDHVLAFDQDEEYLYCPNCTGLPVADENELLDKINHIEDNFLNHSEMVSLLQEYGAATVIEQLVLRLNRGSSGLPTENRMMMSEFLHPTKYIKNIYANMDDFGDDVHLEDSEMNELQEQLDTLLDANSTLIAVLKHLREKFAIAIEVKSNVGNWNSFFGSYNFPHTEYWLCSERCMRSTVGAREEIRDEFIKSREIFRSFPKVQREDVETIYDFGDFWYELMLSLGFGLTLDYTTQDVFTTDFPDCVSIFDIEEFLNCIDNSVQDQIYSRKKSQEHHLVVDKDEFETCGTDVFGSNWSEVRKKILLSNSNTDAHPLFFELTKEEEFKLPNWRRPRTREITQILYPDYFSLLLKLQIFPLLKNGELKSSVSVLGDLTAKRGNHFEKNVYEFFQSRDIESYRGCEISKKEPNEVDVIFLLNDELYFCEVKYVLPTLNMQTQKGIRDVNETFDNKIFKESPSGDKNKDGGKAFPEKVANWNSLDAGTEFTHTPDRDESSSEQIPSKWKNCNSNMLVISNFVPSYLEKQGVKFLTDLELYQWIEDDKNVFYKAYS